MFMAERKRAALYRVRLHLSKLSLEPELVFEGHSVPSPPSNYCSYIWGMIEIIFATM